MLTYDFSKRDQRSLYKYLYDCIRSDILRGRLHAGDRLPSKREMARDNGVSVRTVMNAYDQLMTEGYLTSREKQGYFVARVDAMPDYQPEHMEYTKIYKEEEWFADFTTNNIVYEKFPFTIWRHTVRECLSMEDRSLIHRAHFLGVEELREEIASYLYRSRGMRVSPECILIGASIEYLYERLIRLLPDDACYGIETPGYRKIPRIYQSSNVRWVSIGMDKDGIHMDSLRQSGATVVHVSPEHHYPLGTVMSAVRRQELLTWVAEEPDRYIIEDDYDCEFRYRSHSIPALHSLDIDHRVIYMNTFSKTLTPAIRISYMVLPEKLMERYVQDANFYSNSASSLEQYSLSRFIQQGDFERHLSRMKKYYRTQGELLAKAIRQSSDLPMTRISSVESGTHLLLQLDTPLTDRELCRAARQQGICVSCLSEFCTRKEPQYDHTLVLNYSGMSEERLQEAVCRLGNIFA